MRLQPILVTSGLVVCAGLGISLLQERTELRTLAAQRVELDRSAGATQAEIANVDEHLNTTSAAIAHLPSPPSLVGRIPVEQVRALVAPTIAAIKAEQATHPLPPRQPPPPDGPMGTVFPELMGDPQYNLLQKQWEKLLISGQWHGRLEKLGLPPQTIQRVLDLLAEREMTALDYQSLRGQYRFDARAYEQQQAEHNRINTQLEATLGPELYDKLSSNVPLTTTTLQPDGRVTYKMSVGREILSFGPAYFAQNSIQTLQTRLSYSAEPLTPTQLSQLNAVLAAHTADGPRYLSDQGLWAPDARAVLSPAQQAAVDELKAEREAGAARSRLPRS